MDGIDNNHNGFIDEKEEGLDNDSRGPEWAYNLDNKDIIIPKGRIKEFLNGNEVNPFYSKEIPIINQNNQLEYIKDTQGDVRGKYKYIEERRSLIFDIYTGRIR